MDEDPTYESNASSHRSIQSSDSGSTEALIQPLIIDELPDFANEENQELHRRLLETEKRLESAEEEILDIKQRTDIMVKHKKTVEQELEHVRALILVKQTETQTEKHLRIISSKEHEKLTADNSKKEKQLSRLQSETNKLNGEVFKLTEKKEEIKQRLNWKTETLEQWTLAARQKEADQIALEKYKRADELKIKNLNIRLQNVSKQVAESRKELAKEVTETKTIQVELDNTALEFKQLHLDRLDIISKWDETTQQIHRKDNCILKLSEQMMNHSRELSHSQATLAAENKELENQKSIAKKLEKEKSKMNRSLERARNRLNRVQREQQKKQDELNLNQSTLDQVRLDLIREQGEMKRIKQSVEKMEKKIKVKEKTLQSEQNRYDHCLDEIADITASQDESDALLQQKTQELESLKLSKNKLKTDLFKQQSQFSELQRQEAKILSDLKNNKATVRNLSLKINELDKRSIKEEEKLYLLDFSIQQLTKKVERASGKRSQKENIELARKIDELQRKLEVDQSHESDLKQQNKKFSDDLRKAKKQYDEIVNQRKHLVNRITEYRLSNESIEEEIAKASKQRSQLLVQRDEQQLKEEELKQRLNNIMIELKGLENRKSQLSTTIQQRKLEIDQLRKMEFAKLKNEEGMKHEAVREVRSLESQIHSAKSKYETLCARIRGSGDGSGNDANSKSQVYFMIQKAQQREELQRKGDQLDREITLCIKETRQLEKHLKKVNLCNTRYRDSVNGVNNKHQQSDPELERKQKLEDKFKSLNQGISEKKQELEEVQSSIDALTDELFVTSEQLKDLNDEMERNLKEKLIQESDVNSQKERLKRANHVFDGINSKLKQNTDDGLTNRDHLMSMLQRKLAKRKTKAVVNVLSAIAKRAPELEDAITQVLSDQGFAMQSQSQRSSQKSSVVSSKVNSRRNSRPGTADSTTSQASAVSVIQLEL